MMWLLLRSVLKHLWRGCRVQCGEFDKSELRPALQRVSALAGLTDGRLYFLLKAYQVSLFSCHMYTYKISFSMIIVQVHARKEQLN